VLFTYDSLRPNVSGGIGFLGLLVVLLTGSRALWVPLVTFAFAAILAGSTRLRIALGLDASLAGVLQGTLVLVVLLFNGVRERLLLRRAASADGGASPASAAPTPEVSAKAAAHE
jgi:simple sugar transport system permease protein